MKPGHIVLIALFTLAACKKDDDIYSIVTDVDCNVYHTVKIGSQVWMVKNLKTTRFSDGSDIPLVTDRGEWKSQIAPAYCWYDNNKEIYKDTYGAL